MSTTFHVDTERIAQAAGDIAHIAGEVEAHVSAMMARLTSLQDAWQGSAAASFQAVAGQWQSTQRQVRDSLESIGRVLAAAGADYAETEARATRLFS